MAMAVVSTQQQAKWNSGLFDCFSDMESCLLSCCVGPCIVYGMNADKIHEGCCGSATVYMCCTCFTCMFAGNMRRRIREKFGLPEEPCSDCMVHCFCSPCGVCQEYRELKVRPITAAPNQVAVMMINAPQPVMMQQPMMQQQYQQPMGQYQQPMQMAQAPMQQYQQQPMQMAPQQAPMPQYPQQQGYPAQQ